MIGRKYLTPGRPPEKWIWELPLKRFPQIYVPAEKCPIVWIVFRAVKNWVASFPLVWPEEKRNWRKWRKILFKGSEMEPSRWGDLVEKSCCKSILRLADVLGETLFWYFAWLVLSCTTATVSILFLENELCCTDTRHPFRNTLQSERDRKEGKKTSLTLGGIQTHDLWSQCVRSTALLQPLPKIF